MPPPTPGGRHANPRGREGSTGHGADGAKMVRMGDNEIRGGESEGDGGGSEERD